eukprot:gene1893-1152_t
MRSIAVSLACTFFAIDPFLNTFFALFTKEKKTSDTSKQTFGWALLAKFTPIYLLHGFVSEFFSFICFFCSASLLKLKDLMEHLTRRNTTLPPRNDSAMNNHARKNIYSYSFCYIITAGHVTVSLLLFGIFYNELFFVNHNFYIFSAGNILTINFRSKSNSRERKCKKRMTMNFISIFVFVINKHKKTIKTHVILSIVTLSEHITNDQIKTSVYPSNSLLRDWTELLVLLFFFFFWSFYFSLSRSNFSVFWEVLKLSLFRFLTLANHTIFFHYLFHIIYLHLTGLHLYSLNLVEGIMVYSLLLETKTFFFFLSFCPDPLLLAFLTFLRWEQLTYLYGVLFYFLIFLLFLHHSKGGGFNQPLKYRPSSREKVLSREE